MSAEIWASIVPESVGERDIIEYTKTGSRYCDRFKESIWGKNGRRKKRQDENMQKIDVFSKDIIFLPIAEENHWNLAVICNPKKAFDDLTIEWINKPTDPSTPPYTDLVRFSSISILTNYIFDEVLFF